MICYRDRIFPQRAVVLLPLERDLNFFCVLSENCVVHLFFVTLSSKVLLSRCATEMLVAAAYRVHLSVLDTLSTRWSCIQCDIKF